MLKATTVFYNQKGSFCPTEPVAMHPGDIWQPVISVDAADSAVALIKDTTRAAGFTAFMPLRYQLAGLADTIYHLRIGANLYKKTYADAERDIRYTKQFMDAVFDKKTKWHSVELFDASMRGTIINTDGYHYVTTGNVVSALSADATDRSRIFTPDWHASDEYDFWRRDDQPQADFIMTDQKNVGMAVYSADCILALIYDRPHNAVCICHSMWRQLIGAGTTTDTDKASIMETVIETMTQQYGTNPADVEVVLYPCASKLNYEVSYDVTLKFCKNGLGRFVSSEDNKYTIDLNGTAEFLFIRAGVNADNIQRIPFTTDDPEFASMRNAQKSRAGKTVIELDLDTNSRNFGSKITASNPQNILFVETF